MTPNELWLHISPKHPSDSLRGWSFVPYDVKKEARRGAIMKAVALLIIAAIACFVWIM